MSREEPTVDRLLVGVSGSIAILNLPTYLVTLRKDFAREIRVVMTDSAAQMLPPRTVALFCDEVIAGEPVPGQGRAGHIELALWADVFLILPASANVLGQAANGLAHDLLTTTILASPKPVVFCPNLNTTMWEKRAVQRNVRTLAEDGHLVVGPERARAYEVGTGETAATMVLPDPDVLVKRLKDLS